MSWSSYCYNVLSSYIFLRIIQHLNLGQRFYHSCLISLKLWSECKLGPWTLLENTCLQWNKHIITSNRSFCIKSILIIKVPSISSVAKCKRYKSESPEVDCCKEYHKAVAVFKRALSENITQVLQITIIDFFLGACTPPHHQSLWKISVENPLFGNHFVKYKLTIQFAKDLSTTHW